LQCIFVRRETGLEGSGIRQLAEKHVREPAYQQQTSGLGKHSGCNPRYECFAISLRPRLQSLDLLLRFASRQNEGPPGEGKK